MKIVYYFSKNRPESELAVVRSIYGENAEILRENPLAATDVFENGDFLVCGSVDELSETALPSADKEEIVKGYMLILRKGTELLFDKSAQCNSLFIKTLTNGEQDFENVLRKCVANYLGQKEIMAKYARKHAFTAESHGKKMGIKKGTKLKTKKSVLMKEQIKQLSKDFEGSMNDEALLQQLGIARNTYYKYKKELKGE